MTRNRALSVFLVNAVILATGVFVLELSFGNWLRPNRMNRLNLVRSRTVRYDASALYPSTKPVTYTRDRWGLRGSFDDPAEIDILTLGGSAADQRFIADGFTWQDVMQRSFAAAGRRVTLANAGVDGQSTYGHILNFQWWFPFVPGLKPRYVLVYVGNNDLYRDAGYEMDDLTREGRGWKARVRDSSVLYHLVRTLRSTWEARVVHDLAHHRDDIGAWQWTTTPLNNGIPAGMEARIEAYRKRLRILAGEIRAMGATPIFVTQRRFVYRRRDDGTIEGNARVNRLGKIEINGVDLYYMMAAMRRATLDVAAEVGAIGIDAAAEIDWTPDDFYDSVHNTPTGAEKLGRYLYEHLAGVY